MMQRLKALILAFLLTYGALNFGGSNISWAYYARTEFTGDGSQDDFTIDWEYLAVSDVKTTIDGIPETDFEVNDNIVTFDDPPANDADIAIYRQTALDTIQEFTRAGTPSSGGFNAVLKRIQYIGQELLDIGESTADAAVSAAEAAAAQVSATASAAAAAASAASINLPSIVSNGGKYLRAKADETGLEYRTAAQTVADIGAAALSVITTKGDLYAGTASGAVTRVGVGANDTILIADSAQASGWKTGALSLLLGAATQAEMETASSTTTYSSPGRAQYHPGVAKAWANWDSSATPTVHGGRNVSSVTKNGTGDFTVNFATSFSVADYAVVVNCMRAAGASIGMVSSNAAWSSSATTGAVAVQCRDDANTLVDPVRMTIVVFGDQ